MAHYDRLTALDASFLEIEDENCHMHVAATMLFDPGRLRTADAGVDATRIRAYIESRLHLMPRYRQKLAYIPVEQHPVWVDDPSFNLFYHVRHTSLPKPGDERQLKRLCGRILSQKLDHTKPLWENWIVEGLPGGRFAFIAKVHHCMIDGVSGADLLAVLLSRFEEAAVEPAPPWQPRPAPSVAELVAGEAWRRTKLALDVARGAASALASPARAAAAAWEQAAGVVETFRETLTPASETPLNPSSIGPHRRFDWLRHELAEVKAVRSALGGTLNDVVLAVVAGAARRFLERLGVATSGLDFRSLIPVSVRSQADHGMLGNKVAQMLARLPVDEPDPRRRLARVVETTSKLKQSRQVQATELIEEIGEWTSTAVLSRAMRLAARRRPYNLIVTNVPGPQAPLFLLGAPLRESYPMVPLFSNQALGIALFSYAGGLHWGLNGDWDALPDLHAIVGDLQDSFTELCAAARPIEVRSMAAGAS